MSFSYFHGILPVENGRRVQSVRHNKTYVWHAHYDTTFEAEKGTFVSGVLRVFSPSSMALLPDDSLVDVDGRIIFLTGKKVTDWNDDGFILEPLRMSSFCANPLQINSDSFLPLDTVPRIHILGHVVGKVITNDIGEKFVDVKAGSYILNKDMECIYRCRFTASSRWAKVNIPVPGSALCIFGRAHNTVEPDGTGILIITVDEITYNPGIVQRRADDVESNKRTPRRKLRVKRKRGDQSQNNEDEDVTVASASGSPSKPSNSASISNSNPFPNTNLMPYPNLQFMPYRSPNLNANFVPYSNQSCNANFIPYPNQPNYDPNFTAYPNSNPNLLFYPYAVIIPNANGASNSNAALNYSLGPLGPSSTPDGVFVPHAIAAHNPNSVATSNAIPNANFTQNANPIPSVNSVPDAVQNSNNELSAVTALNPNAIPNPNILNNDGPNVTGESSLNKMSALNEARGTTSSSGQERTQQARKRASGSKKAVAKAAESARLFIQKSNIHINRHGASGQTESESASESMDIDETDEDSMMDDSE